MGASQIFPGQKRTCNREKVKPCCPEEALSLVPVNLNFGQIYTTRLGRCPEPDYYNFIWMPWLIQAAAEAAEAQKIYDNRQEQ